MNAETLIGTVLGTCTLQKLIGQGGMGAVFLAQQSRPRRQVAVKVLLPAMALTTAQKAAFLERFRRETDAAASLDHPNILPVHEYGEREGLAYLVMPYVSGGTLGDELEREGQLPLPLVMLYLEQIAAALQVAHESNVIHRDIKPANILMTPEKRLLLSDFGLVKIVSEGETPQTRLTRAGAPIGTPDYMSPEQVIGNDVDARADIYSLGVVLYHMITGETPFKGEMAMQVAVQHLQVPPPSLRQIRPDLPIAAEQVVLRTLSKRPEDRYAYARDLASAFRAALTAAGVQLGETPLLTLHVNNARNFTPRGLFDPSWQRGKGQDDRNAEQVVAQVPFAPIPPMPPMPPVSPIPTRPTMRTAPSRLQPDQPSPPQAEQLPAQPAANAQSSMLPQMSQVFNQTSEGGITTNNDIVAKTSMTIPSMTGLMASNVQAPVTSDEAKTKSDNTPIPVGHARLGVRSRLLRPISDTGKSASSKTISPAMPEIPSTPAHIVPTSSLSVTSFEQELSNNPISSLPVSERGFSPMPQVPDTLQSAENSTPVVQNQPGVTRNLASSMSFVSNQEGGNVTRKLGDSLVDYPTAGGNSTMRLTQSMRVVKMPVAGQPGRYVTGLLPTLPKTPDEGESRLPELMRKGKVFAQQNRKYLTIVSVVLLALFVLSFTLLIQSRIQQNTKSTQTAKVKPTPNLLATSTAQAVATTEANTLFLDPLNQNSHNWTVSTNTQGPKQYEFMDGAYHITAIDPRASAISLLTQDEPLPGSFTYTLSMAEIKGDDSTVNNQFGMILRFNIQKKSGRNVTTFYAFEVVNAKAGEYQFWKYDDSVQGVSPWTKIWSHSYGPEYHFAHGPYGINTFRVSMKGPKFIFTVNKKKVGAAQDNSLTSGQIGMLVNWYKTEVAFSNLLVTYN